MATRTVNIGGGNFSATGTWIEAAVPTAADDVVTTVVSTGTLTVDSGATRACRSFTIANSVNVTFASGALLTIGDGSGGAMNLTGMGTMTLSGGTLQFISTSNNGGTGWSITTAGKTMPATTVDGVGGKWVQQDAYSSANSSWGLTNGTWVTNASALTGSIGFTGSATKTLDITNSTVTQNTNSAFNSGATGTTLTTTGSTFVQSGTDFNGGGFTFNNLTHGAAGPTVQNVTINGTWKFLPSIRRNMSVNGNITVNGAIDMEGNSASARLLLTSNTRGTQRTITLGASCTFKTGGSKNLDVRDIAMTGGAAGELDISAITGNSGDALGNSGITFTPAATQTHTASAGGNYDDATKWTSRVPLPQDNVIVNGNTTGTLTLNGHLILGADVTFTGFAGTFACSSTNFESCGNVTLATGMSLTGSGATGWILAGRGAQTLTSVGIQFPMGVDVACPGGSYTAQDAVNTAKDFQVAAGTWTSGNQSMSVLTLIFSGAITRVLTLGTSTVTTTSTAATQVVNVSGLNASVSAATSTIVISGATASTRTFAGFGQTYGTLTYTVANSSGQLTVQGSNTWSTGFNFTDTTAARSVAFTNGTTQTFLVAPNINGTAGILMSIISTSAGNAATFSGTFANLGNVRLDYVSIKDNTPTGGATWSAFSSTKVSNTGIWNFVTVTLAATAATSASTTGTAIVNRQVTGSMPTSASTTGTAIVNLGMSGTLPTASSATGSLALHAAVAGKLPTSASTTGALGITAAVAGKLPEASSMTGTAIVNRGVAGSMPSSASTTGALGLLQALAGQLPTASSGTGALGISRAAAGQLPAASSMTGNAVVNLGVSGALPSASSMTGNVIVNRGVSGSMPSASSCRGSLGLSLQLDGKLPTSSSMTGTTIANRGVAGQLPSAASCTGGLGLLSYVDGKLPTSSSMIGNLSLAQQLSGKLPTSARCTATAIVNRQLTGALPASASGKGSLEVLVQLTGALPSSASCRGALGLIKPVSAHAPVAASSSGTITTQLGLTGRLPTSARCRGNLSVKLALTGTLPASASVRGAGSIQYQLRGKLSAAAMIRGSISRQGVLFDFDLQELTVRFDLGIEEMSATFQMIG